MALDLVVEDSGGNALVRAKGDVDLYSSPQLRETLLKAIGTGNGAIGIDLSEVSYMDSSGVATLVEGLKGAGAKSREFALIAPSNSVMKVLQLSRLDTVFAIREQL